MLSQLKALFVRVSQRQEVATGAVGVQVLGDHNTVLVAGEARLVLYGVHRARRPPANERELLLTELRATTLVGRDDELGALESWLKSAHPISVRCLTGEGGAGKTRLGIELCERAEAMDWAAGFARHDDLRRFHEQHSPTEWRWPRPTLVVVDYAAALIEVLRAWLEALARRIGDAEEHPLRVLLLERYADREAGWWAELTRPGGMSGRSPVDLFDPVEPVALRPLPNLEARRALLAEAMAATARFRGVTPVPVPPSPGTDAVFDERLARDTIESEPLYLAMAGMVAVTSGAPTALALSRIDLAQRVADSERNRLIRVATSARVDCDLVLHLAACVTLQGGCELAAAETLVEQERRAVRDEYSVRNGQLVRLLHDALTPAAGLGVDAVRPDLIGEAFLVREVCRRQYGPDGSCSDQRPAEHQAAIVTRAFQQAGRRVVETVIRTAQDLAEGNAAHPAVAWLDHLAGATENPFALMAIANTLPAQTLALRERGAEITGRIVRALRERSADDPDLLPPLAAWLNNLGVRFGGVGGREEALAAAQEAADLYRALATKRPDVFRPDLAMSLSNLANTLSDLGRPRRRWRRRRRQPICIARWRRSGPTRSGPIWRCR
jgi:hypothetical protein